jgi:glycosyltransferase involved in cell wall biosynthesis
VPGASVIISTYNRPEHLERCLESYRHQTEGDFEILVADDGSGPETTAVIERARERHTLPIRHVTQEDRGFRKSRILNEAVRQAESDYIIFTDGDCLARENFVAMHLRYRRPGCYLVGRSVKLSRERSERIDLARIQSGRRLRVTLRDLWEMLLPRRNRYVPYGIYLPGDLGFRLAQRLKQNRAPRGLNLSVWKPDVVRVNGWNEDFEGWGLEDVELGYRLRLLELEPVLVVYKAINFHLWHPEEDKRSRQPRLAYNATRERGLPWCPNGLVKAETPEQGLAEGGKAPVPA